jgi:hypothetical protein
LRLVLTWDKNSVKSSKHGGAANTSGAVVSGDVNGAALPEPSEQKPQIFQR